MKIRKNQKNLTTSEWDNFICAFKNLKEGLLKGVDKPTLDDFADEHAAAFKEKNHDWQVHSHGSEKVHWGLQFLAWHRVFLNEFENRLRKEVPGVTIPYWNAFQDPFPEALKKISDNEGKRVSFPSEELWFLLPSFEGVVATQDAQYDMKEFDNFQFILETGYHNHVHAELGRTMGRRHSPRDAGFWLHHAFVDRQWGHWFEKQNGTTPSNMDELIKGDEIVKGKRVKDVLHTTQLGYVYGNGIYYNIEKQGSDTFVTNLEKGMILCAKLGDEFYAKIFVYSFTDVAAFLTIQHFPYLLPGTKLGVFPPDTMYCDLLTGKLNAAKEEAHIKIVKKAVGESFAYLIEAVNGTKLATFTGTTNFAANNGAGTSDFEMLYI